MDTKTAIQALAQTPAPYLQTAEVIAVNRAQASCTVRLSDGTELPDVRLRPLLQNTGAFLIIPKVGSDVVIGFISKSEAVALIFSEADELIYNEGKNKGLVKIAPLIEEINRLKKEINDLKSIIRNWLPAPNDGGAKLKADAASWCVKTLKDTEIKDLENDKIKH